MKTFLFALLLAVSTAFAAAPHSARPPGHHPIHQWRMVDLMKNGQFRFQGSDNLSYYYSVNDPASRHFVPGPSTNVDGIYFLPQGGQWTHTSVDNDLTNVVQSEPTIIYFDSTGAPADGQYPPADDGGETQ